RRTPRCPPGGSPGRSRPRWTPPSGRCRGRGPTAIATPRTRRLPRAPGRGAGRTTPSGARGSATSLLLQRVPSAPNRADQGASEGLLELSAEVADVHVHDVRRALEVAIPQDRKSVV